MRTAVGLKDVAKEAGVSVSTASLALNGSPKIHAETAARIKEVANKLGYIPNARARALVRKRTNIIGLVIPDILNSFYAEVSQAIENALRGYGYQLLLCNTSLGNPQELEYIQLAKQGVMDGIIFACTGSDDPLANKAELVKLAKHYLPVLLVNRQAPNSDLPTIDCDRFQGAYQATEYLCALGHQDIAFVGGFMSVGASYQRFDGYYQAMQDLNLPVHKKWALDGRFRAEIAYDQVQKLIRENELPTAFLCSNDQMALGVIRCLAENSIAVPGEVSVCGFDDTRLSAFFNPALTTVKIPITEMGEAAAQAMVDLLDKKRIPKMQLFPTQLVVRNSCERRVQPEKQELCKNTS